MARWSAAPAIRAIFEQANELWPDRDKRADGTIGDRRHRRRKSDHNPNGNGIVHAGDLTHDPDNGVDAHAWAEEIRARADGRIRYVISDERIFSSYAVGGVAPYQWRDYHGSNPHKRHVHVSVKHTDAARNDLAPWFTGARPRPPSPPPRPTDDQSPTEEEVMALPMLERGARGQYVRNMQGLLVAHGNSLAVDGIFGRNTLTTLRSWQGRAGLAADGICGPKTWSHLVGV